MAGVPVLVPALFASNGASPASGAKLYAYIKGTNTPQTFYTDEAITTPAANPTIANSLGATVRYLDPSKNYDLVAKTSDEATTLFSVTYSVDANNVSLGSGWEDALEGAFSDVAVQPVGGPAARELAELLGNGYDKSPVLDWENKAILWLGTSIPHQAAGEDGYPERVGERLKATVTNNSWSGSHAFYGGTAGYAALATNAARTAYISSLSMTEDDRAAGETAYGGSSAYNDSFDAVTLASEMTCDHRIKTVFDAGTVDVVMLDHNHNDRGEAAGTLAPTAQTITGITKGATTTITVSGTWAVGDAIAFTSTGITKLGYCAARVQSVGTGTVTININSSGYSGSFSAGTAYKLDRSTQYGAFEFLIYYIYWSALNAGQSLPTIILSSAPSEFTGDDYSATIYSNARFIQAIADKWTLSMFDVASNIRISEKWNNTYLPDTVHPSTAPTRVVFANVWAEWLSGGAVKLVNDNDYVARSIVRNAYTDNREVEYSRFHGGATTPDFIVTGSSTIKSEDWVAIADWTTNTGSCTVGAAPYGGGVVNALNCTNASSGTPKYLTLTGLTAASAVKLEFPLYLTTVAGLVASTGSTTIARVSSASGVWLALILSHTAAGSELLVGWFDNIGDGAADYNQTSSGFTLTAATAYTVKLEAVQQTATRTGIAILTVDGVQIGDPIELGDLDQVDATIIQVGAISTTAADIDAYIGPLTYSSLTIPDYSARLTGDLTWSAGNTYEIINGKVVRTKSASNGLGTAAYVADSSLVHISGTETITGSKTFTASPTISGNTLSQFFRNTGASANEGWWRHIMAGGEWFFQALTDALVSADIFSVQRSAGTPSSFTVTPKIRGTGSYANTTASSADMVFTNADGSIGRSTSSEVFKRNIEPLDAGYVDALLANVTDPENGCLIWYASNCEADNPDHHWVGISAEKLATVAPHFVRFETDRVEVELVTHMVDGEPTQVEQRKLVPLETPVPRGVMYERLVVPLLQKVAQQEERLKRMELALAPDVLALDGGWGDGGFGQEQKRKQQRDGQQNGEPVFHAENLTESGIGCKCAAEIDALRARIVRLEQPEAALDPETHFADLMLADETIDDAKARLSQRLRELRHYLIAPEIKVNEDGSVGLTAGEQAELQDLERRQTLGRWLEA
jgi:hypothetical protein